MFRSLHCQGQILICNEMSVWCKRTPEIASWWSNLLPSVIFPLNRALIYGQTAPAGLWPNRMFQKVQEVILRAAAGAHKFLELSLGQGGQMLCPINYQKLGWPLWQTPWVASLCHINMSFLPMTLAWRFWSSWKLRYLMIMVCMNL